MKVTLLVAGSVLCACAWHANAQDATADPTNVAQASALNAEGPDAHATSMSGGSALSQGKTREEVYQDLVHSRQDPDWARIQDIYRGN